jgi:hypothetical protein
VVTDVPQAPCEGSSASPSQDDIKKQVNFSIGEAKWSAVPAKGGVVSGKATWSIACPSCDASLTYNTSRKGNLLSHWRSVLCLKQTVSKCSGLWGDAHEQQRLLTLYLLQRATAGPSTNDEEADAIRTLAVYFEQHFTIGQPQPDAETRTSVQVKAAINKLLRKSPLVAQDDQEALVLTREKKTGVFNYGRSVEQILMPLNDVSLGNLANFLSPSST